MKPSQVIKHPMAEQWRENLRSFSMQIGFKVILSKAMLEFLCAVADNVAWDRSLYWKSGVGENWVASAASLVKRGLIESKSKAEIDKRPDWNTWEESCDWTHWQLTPAGKCVVELVTLAGMFQEADRAIVKRTKKA